MSARLRLNDERQSREKTKAGDFHPSGGMVFKLVWPWRLRLCNLPIYLFSSYTLAKVFSQGPIRGYDMYTNIDVLEDRLSQVGLKSLEPKH